MVRPTALALCVWIQRPLEVVFAESIHDIPEHICKHTQFHTDLWSRSSSGSKVTDSRPESGEAISSSNFFRQAESFRTGRSALELADWGTDGKIGILRADGRLADTVYYTAKDLQ